MNKTARSSLKIFISLILFSIMTIRISYTCSLAPDSYRPVYLSFEALRNGVQSQVPEPLRNPGKILVKGDLIFISERFEGVHVIDNSDPTLPKHIAFITVPGNIDLAMKNSILYADSYVDLLAIDVSNPNAVFVTERLEHMYPNEPFLEEETFWSEPLDKSKGIVIGKELVSLGGGSCGGSGHGGGGHSIFGCGKSADNSGGAGSPAAAPPAAQSSGMNGSLARITIVNDALYLLAGSMLKTVSILDHLHPVHINALELSPDIETLYPYKETLFVGGQTGVQIIDISIPDDPRLMSSYQHAWQCDPVVVNGDIAYVTLRTGTGCQRGVNQLVILNVSNLKAPDFIASYPLDNPHGLAIDGTTLFIADGFSGLRVFDAGNPLNLIQIEHFPGKRSEDIILYEDRAYVIGKNGLYQYNYSNPAQFVFLSHLPVVD